MQTQFVKLCKWATVKEGIFWHVCMYSHHFMLQIKCPVTILNTKCTLTSHLTEYSRSK